MASSEPGSGEVSDADTVEECSRDSPSLRVRAPMATSNPARARWTAMALPIPRLAPVTRRHVRGAGWVGVGSMVMVLPGGRAGRMPGCSNRIIVAVGSTSTRGPDEESTLPTTPANGIDIAYATHGDPSSPPLLAIHGLGAQMTDFSAAFVDGLAEPASS